LRQLAGALLDEADNKNFLTVVSDVARRSRPEVQGRVQLGDDQRAQFPACRRSGEFIFQDFRLRRRRNVFFANDLLPELETFGRLLIGSR